MLAVGALVLPISACEGFGTDFAHLPQNAPVVLPVMISQDGRVITGRAAEPCGQQAPDEIAQRPLLGDPAT
jgi:hypothetical protein